LKEKINYIVDSKGEIRLLACSDIEEFCTKNPLFSAKLHYLVGICLG
jgi:hypothetical protein